MDAKTALSKRENFQELLDTVKEDFKPMRQKIKLKPYDLDNQDENGKTVLINVVELRNNTEQMWVLLDYGADPNIQDNEGKTALFHSCLVDRKDMIVCLLLFGADPEIEDNEGKKCFEEYRDDMSLIKEKIDDIKREFISLTRKRRKFLKYIFDETDKDYGAKILNIESLANYYVKINKENIEDARKDATLFIQGARLFKSTDDVSITFEEYIVAICRIVKVHGMKVIDDFINKFKEIRKKVEPKIQEEDNGEGDENKDL
jgi:hypothetical protein